MNPRTAAVARRIAALALLAALPACTRGDVARWRGRSMGTLVAAPGMSLTEVERWSTLSLRPYHPGMYGGSGVFFDFEVGGYPLRFAGCDQYNMDVKDGQVTDVRVASARETWPALTAALGETAERMRALGWQRRFTLAELDDWRRRPARKIGTSTSGTVAAFQWTKGDLLLGFGVARQWTSIPFWRRADHAPWFWHSVYMSRMDAEERQRLDKQAPADP